MASLPRRRRAVADSVYLLCLVLATFVSFLTSFSGSPLSDWSQFTLTPIIACISASLNTFEYQPSYQSPFWTKFARRIADFRVRAFGVACEN